MQEPSEILKSMRPAPAAGCVEFRVLGTVDAALDGQAIALGHARQCCVLVSLLVDANSVVPADRLIDRVWADRPPRHAREALHSYVSRLRRVLDQAPVTIRARTGGYLLDADPMTVDLHRFSALMTRAAAEADDSAGALMEQALALWRGPAFAGLDTPWLTEVREDLDRRRIAAELERNDLALRQGRHAELVADLTRACSLRPFDERLAGQLVVALYRCGRQADALGHLVGLRIRLADELGVDPSPRLQELYQQLLTADAALEAPDRLRESRFVVEGVVSPAAVGRSRRETPAQLPSDVFAFTGRGPELAALDASLGPHQHDDGPPRDGSGHLPVVVLCGTAGVGKTTLALHWAHKILDRFPDGQLYLDLRGYDLSDPVPPGDALAGLLHGLGLSAADIPPGVAERAARFRSEVAGRRVLIVLDNARDVGQIRPLLPGSPTSLVIVTSRESLSSLVTVYGARRVQLDLLPSHDSLALLHRLIGDRVAAEPEAARVLVERCAQLPLALRVAAELAASRPDVDLANLVDELEDEQQRLVLLDSGGDPHSDLFAVFSWSYRCLPEPAAHAFRVACLHPGPDLDAYAVAALMGARPDDTHRTLQALARMSLITPNGADRYRMHDLLRAFSRRLANEQEAQPDLRAAMTRLIEYYLDAAVAATDILHPPATPPRRPPQTLGAALRPIRDPAAARAWLDTERVNIVATCAHAATIGWGRCAIGLATTLSRLLTTGEFDADPEALHRQASRAGGRQGGARAECTLGLVFWHQAQYSRATAHLQRALDLFGDTGDPGGEAMAHFGLGLVLWRRGRYHHAVRSYEEALGRFLAAGFKRGQAHALHGLGQIHARRGHDATALDHFLKARALFQAGRDRAGEGYALHGLGQVDAARGDHRRAAECFEQALGLFWEDGDRAGEPLALLGLAGSASRDGRSKAATDLFTEALPLYRQVGDRAGEAEALNDLGEHHRRNGAPDEAKTAHLGALGLATQIGLPHEQARANDGLAALRR